MKSSENQQAQMHQKGRDLVLLARDFRVGSSKASSIMTKIDKMNKEAHGSRLRTKVIQIHPTTSPSQNMITSKKRILTLGNV